MKKTLFLSVCIALFSLNVNAAEIKEGALYCVSSKKAIKYYNYLEQGYDDYAKKLMQRSDCFIKGKNEEVIIKSEQKKFVELELLSGFTIWTKKENIIR